ncbi:MAG: ABC transporter permease subunit [Clostridiales bacterium]|nr:ABC transporter permease subunit [Clostridiales bacterium]
MYIMHYFAQNASQIIQYSLQHIQLTALSVGLAILIGVPLGILICYVDKLSKPVIGVSNVLQAIPSMALLGFAIPFLGIGIVPAVVAVMLYSLLPIIKNTYIGITNINPGTIESARGIGLTKLQILRKIQIPLALPVIMGGVRISAVTAVGLVTIAAFIGAGGLGFLVFSGIRTVNNAQILAGAIPACMLALAVDYLAGLVEKLVTPISLQHVKSKSGEAARKTRRHQKVILAIGLMLIAALFLYNAVENRSNSQNALVIGGKDFSEQDIVANMAAILIEHDTNVKVSKKLELGGTQVCFSALRGGSIDLYIEYTGTAYGDILELSGSSDTELVYDTIKSELKGQYNIEVLAPMSFNNTYTLTVKPETAQTGDLKTISDLNKIPGRLRLGATLEFLNRDDGFPGLQSMYRLDFKEIVGIDGSARYIALMNNDVDVVDAFSTDSLIKKFKLVVLKDDKDFFPPYYAVPLIRQDALEKYPEIVPVLEKLGNSLSNDIMIELNYQVDELQMNPEAVARKYLQDHGLLK